MTPGFYYNYNFSPLLIILIWDLFWSGHFQMAIFFFYFGGFNWGCWGFYVLGGWPLSLVLSVTPTHSRWVQVCEPCVDSGSRQGTKWTVVIHMFFLNTPKVPILIISMMSLVACLVAPVTRSSVIPRVLLEDGIIEASITASQSYSHCWHFQNASSLFLKTLKLGADITF